MEYLTVAAAGMALVALVGLVQAWDALREARVQLRETEKYAQQLEDRLSFLECDVETLEDHVGL